MLIGRKDAPIFFRHWNIFGMDGLPSLSFGVSPLSAKAFNISLCSSLSLAMRVISSRLKATRTSCYALFFAMCILVGYDSIDLAHGSAFTGETIGT